MVDNFEIIKSLLKFDTEHHFYFLQILARKKDRKDTDIKLHIGANNSSRLIKPYFIYSIEQLDRHKDEIIALCNLFNARAGINLNVRDDRKTSLEFLELAAKSINCGNLDLSRTYNTVVGVNKGSDRMWIVDIDAEDIDRYSEIANIIYNCEPVNTVKIIAKIPSKSGFHLITKPFNVQKFNEWLPNIEIHKNNPVNLWIP